jgi:peptidoglycan/LPS O-acetylase OafA/YrhL
MRSHIYVLDAVRFFAALCVVFFHLSFYDWASPQSTVGQMFVHTTSFRQAAPFTSFGWVGVEIFFVLSGFVIANSANNSSPMAFAKSRVLRLYPAVWICVFFTLAALLITRGQTTPHVAGEFARSVTLWIFGPWLDGVYWSLAVELVFYAIIFTVLLSGRFDRLGSVAWALFAISAVYLVAVIFKPSLFASPLGSRIVLHSDVLQLRYGCFFAIGIWMWLFSARGLRSTDWLGLSAATAVGMLEIAGRAHNMARWEVQPGISVSEVVPVVIWLAIAALMLVVARAPERFAPKSLRAQEAYRHIGQMTYPLYLTHSIVGVFLIREMVSGGTNPWLALAVAVVSMLALSYVVSRYGEPQLRRLLRSAWDRAESNVREARALAFLFKPGGSAAT